MAHIVATAGATGVERHLEALLAGFERAEVEPHLFVPRAGPLVERAEARGIAVSLGAPVRKLAFGESRRLAARLAGAFDMVHAHGPRALFWARRAARAAGIPIVATLHELRRLTLPPGWKRTVWVALEEHDLARVDGVIAVSAFVSDEVLTRHPGWKSRLAVVHGTTPLLLEPPPARVPRAPGAPLRLVAIGRLEWVKRIDLLIRALSLCRKTDWELIVVGRGPEAGALRALAASLHLEERIRWLDGTVDIPGVLARSDVFMTASRSETLGLAALEAMVCGARVVGVRVGALGELNDGDVARWIDPQPEALLAERLAAALDALPRDEAFGTGTAHAAERIRERFAPARLSGQVAQVYRSVLAREEV